MIDKILEKIADHIVNYIDEGTIILLKKELDREIDYDLDTALW